MLKEERYQHIMDELQIRNRILLTDVAAKLEVSEDTIRRDLKELHDLGKLKRVHGGAIARSFNPFSFHREEIYDHPNKALIAQKAVSLLKNGQAYLITGGTTNLELVNLIPKEMHCTFFTPSLPVAMQLSQLPAVETILIGGRIVHDAQIATGEEAWNLLGRIKVDLCFLGAGHLDAAFGLSEFDRDVVELKRAMIKASKKVALLTLSAKLNSTQRYQVCGLDAVHVLATELHPDDPRLDKFRRPGLEIL